MTARHNNVQQRRPPALVAHPPRHGLAYKSRPSFRAPPLLGRRGIGKPQIVCLAPREEGGAGKKKTEVQASVTDVEQQSANIASLDGLLSQPLQNHPRLETGHLPNGLRYVILPNVTPPSRFEAHLEVHAGSVDEGEGEQGIAHLVEHVTFLGSKKREGLLGTGARSNAYTDFHHTVFHVHAPHANANTGEPMLPAVLDALTEIAFEPEFLPSRIEKERKAVVAEAQMMNTIEYRVDCQLLQYLHWENALGCRFPIGKTDQVERWHRSEIMEFWQRHYFPSNATLYIVGDVDVDATKALIAATFGRVQAPIPSPIPSPGAGELNTEVLGLASSPPTTHTSAPSPRSLARPPVDHQWGCFPTQSSFPRPTPISVFRHRLLQLFQLSIFCKLPIQPMTTMQDLRRAFMVRILLSVFQFRINARYVAADPPFVAIEFDHSDSGREGCAVSTLTITSEPKDWEGAVRVAVQEARRLQRFGVTPAELERYKSALLRDSEQVAEGAASVPSLDNLEFVMESLALGHTVLEPRETHACLASLTDSITAEEVNALARSLLSYVSHFHNEAGLVHEYENDPPTAWAAPGPTVATAIVACLPAFMDAATGESTGAAAPMQRGASLATTQHIMGGEAPPADAMLSSDDDTEDPPEGAVVFKVDAVDIERVLAEDGEEVEALADVDVPEALVPADIATSLVDQRQPKFIEESTDYRTEVVQKRLSNGIRVNIRRTDNEPRGAMVRLVAAGGRAEEGRGVVGPDGHGVIAVGTRTLSESGTVGSWSREQVELFCISRLINCVLEANEEFVCMDFHFAVGDGGLAAVMQLLHLFLEQPRWEESAMDRAKQMYMSHFRALPKSLERATVDRIMQAMLGPDRRFRDPSVEEIEALTLSGMEEGVMRQLRALDRVEVSIVGDVDLGEAEEAVLTYLGTVDSNRDATDKTASTLLGQPILVCNPPMQERHTVWHLKDSDERACAYIAGPAPGRWAAFAGPKSNGSSQVIQLPGAEAGAENDMERQKQKQIRQSHPLYASVTLGLLTEIINSRLFTTVRDTLGLTYDVSFELALFDRLPSGWFHVNVTSTPQKIRDAMMASLQVLRSGRSQRFTNRDLLRAKRTLLTRHESDLKDNAYWLALLTHLQSDAVPSKSVECLADLKMMYEAVTVEDIYDAYEQFDFSDEAVFTCIGTSGKEAVLEKSPILDLAMEGSLGAEKGQPESPPDMDPEAFMAALRNFMNATVQAQRREEQE